MSKKPNKKHKGSHSFFIIILLSSQRPLLSLTPFLAAHSVAQTGAEHLRAALASEPALSIVVGGSRVGAARPLNGGLRLLQSQRMVGGQHDST